MVRAQLTKNESAQKELAEKANGGRLIAVTDPCASASRMSSTLSPSRVPALGDYACVTAIPTYSSNPKTPLPPAVSSSAATPEAEQRQAGRLGHGNRPREWCQPLVKDKLAGSMDP